MKDMEMPDVIVIYRDDHGKMLDIELFVCFFGDLANRRTHKSKDEYATFRRVGARRRSCRYDQFAGWAKCSKVCSPA